MAEQSQNEGLVKAPFPPGLFLLQPGADEGQPVFGLWPSTENAMVSGPKQAVLCSNRLHVSGIEQSTSGVVEKHHGAVSSKSSGDLEPMGKELGKKDSSQTCCCFCLGVKV